MAVNITSRSEINVAGGPSMTISQTLSAEAYDLIDVTIADAAADIVVEVQPGSATGQVQFLAVSASQFNPPLTYKVNAGANPSHTLDRALLLIGAGAVGLLGFAPESLLFTNTTGSDITVQILVGRDATP